MNLTCKLFGEKRIAYFSIEIGLTDDIHTYSGGLCVLVCDIISSSADLKIPLVAVSPVSKKGIPDTRDYLSFKVNMNGLEP